MSTLSKTWIGCARRNFRPGRVGNAKPEAIVVHIIVGSLRSADFTFQDPDLAIVRSAHYGVGKNGEIHQYVAEEDTAYHAGNVVDPKARFVRDVKKGVNPNHYTIGIEHEGIPDTPWPEAQLDASARLIAEVAYRHGITIDDEHVIAHRDIRASKTCPGFGVKLASLIERAAGISRAATPAAQDRRPYQPPRTTVVTRAVRLRSKRPSTGVQVLSVLPVGTRLDVTALVLGEPVPGGTSWWCEVGGGSSFFWAGASDAETPD